MLKRPHPKSPATARRSDVSTGVKGDPFIDALTDDDATRPRTRTPTAGAKAAPDTRGQHAARPAARPAGVSVSLSWAYLPIPLQAGAVFALCIGLATLLTPLIGRLIIGGRGLDDAMFTFAAESGVSAAMMAAAAPLLAATFAVAAYMNARRRVERIAQSVSRALLVVLLTWMMFGAWATKLWCLPVDYASCYSRILTVAGLLGGGPILLAGLIAGYWMGRLILKRRAG
jgi:hypothetical protein